jgi:hypothetical protein
VEFEILALAKLTGFKIEPEKFAPPKSNPSRFKEFNSRLLKSRPAQERSRFRQDDCSEESSPQQKK